MCALGLNVKQVIKTFNSMPGSTHLRTQAAATLTYQRVKNMHIPVSSQMEKNR